MRILLVEDEPSAARMMAKGLREQTYAVDIAQDGEGALYQANVNDYASVDSLPNFRLFTWFFVIPGALLMLLAGWGLWREHEVEVHRAYPTPA